MCEKFTHCSTVPEKDLLPRAREGLGLYYNVPRSDCWYDLLLYEKKNELKKNELNSYVANVMAKKVDFVQIH